MRARLVGVALGLAAALLTASASARLPVVERPVTDLAGALDAAASARLEQRLAALAERSGIQAAVLVTRDSSGLPLEDFSLAVAEGWGGGTAGSDRGLLILLVTQARAMRLEVGYGLEGALPDGAVRRELEAAKPELSAGRWAGALELVLAAVERRTARLAPDSRAPGGSAPLGSRLPWTYLAVLGGALAAGRFVFGRGGFVAHLALFSAAPLLVAWLFRAGESWWWAYLLTWLVGAGAALALSQLAREKTVMAGWMATGLAAGALLSLLRAGLQPGLARAADIAFLLSLSVGAALLAPALPWLGRRPWLLIRLLQAVMMASGTTYGRTGRLPAPRDWRGGGGGFGGGGADTRW